MNPTNPMNPTNSKTSNKLAKMYHLLNNHFGDLKWWPAESNFEMIIGAVLTQNTSWKNVEKAIANLKREDLIDPKAIKKARLSELSSAIRSSGYYRIKAQRLKEISNFIIKECRGKIDNVRTEKIDKLRNMLLGVKGIGPETADSILLYAAGKPVFVVDAYTKRIFARHNIIGRDVSYNDVQDLVHEFFSKRRKMLNQFHALLVETAKAFCKKRKPLCKGCPLSIILPK